MIGFLDRNVLKIMTVFSASPGIRLRRKVMQEKTGINNIVLDKTLALLLNLKILSKENGFISLNFNNNETRILLNYASESYNKLKQLPFKEYFMMLDIVSELSRIRDIGDVYLFGSYSKLIFTEESDIDIAVISDEVDRKLVNKAAKKLDKFFKKKIELHFFTKEFHKNKRDPLVREILQNGIKLI
ncbi:nucleotidyltransferase domain-containing protein [Candidatus Pacearchaeota archaeon]|nr:nucleotidyltransferase domain-containing protein [Candidatus Pacearchaeota archaeon]